MTSAREVAESVARQFALVDGIIFARMVDDIESAILSEREECAKVAEQYGQPYELQAATGAMMFRAVTDKISAAIRARALTSPLTAKQPEAPSPEPDVPGRASKCSEPR